MSTNCNFISEIDENECIGQSLNKINNNYLNTRNRICSLDNRYNIIKTRAQTLTTTVCGISSAQIALGWVVFDGRRNKNGAIDTNVTTFAVPSSRFIIAGYNIVDVKKNGTGDYNIQLPLSSIQNSFNNTTLSNSITGLVIGGFAAPSTEQLDKYDVCLLTYHPSNNLDEPFVNSSTIRVRTVNLSGNLVDSSNISLTFFN